MEEDFRLIEDYLPVQKIGEAASSEPRMKGHISTMHVWRARRPLIACRAAAYSALVSKSLFIPKNGPDNKKQSLGRANAAKFIQSLCKYPTPQLAVAEARKHILQGHAERLTHERGLEISVEDIIRGKSPRPRVLDMFAGGGAIPLETARLGGETYAVELNPVAHIIELCTVNYPQRFGIDLADEVEQWGRKILSRIKKNVSDLMPSPSIQAKGLNQLKTSPGPRQTPENGLSVVANYWTRTAACPNPSCKGTVPLYRQTWLRKKSSGYVALKPLPDIDRKIVAFEVVSAASEEALGFDPSEGSEGSSTVCPFCRTTLDGNFIRKYGEEKGFGQQFMCSICLNPVGTGKLYLSGESLAVKEAECQVLAEQRALDIERELGETSVAFRK